MKNITVFTVILLFTLTLTTVKANFSPDVLIVESGQVSMGDLKNNQKNDGESKKVSFDQLILQLQEGPSKKEAVLALCARGAKTLNYIETIFIACDKKNQKLLLHILHKLYLVKETREQAEKMLTDISKSKTFHASVASNILGYTQFLRWLKGKDSKKFSRWTTLTVAKTNSMNLSDTDITDADLKYLTKMMPTLEFLHLSNTKVTDNGMKWVLSLKELCSLNLTATRITDLGMKELSVLPLSSLNVSGTKITDSGLIKMLSLTKARMSILRVANTGITDKAVQELSACKRLHLLDVSGTKITGVGLRKMSYMTNFKYLNMGHTQITPLGLKELSSLKNLSSLTLKGASLKGLTLGDLSALNNLCFLDLSDTEITDKELKNLSLKKVFEMDLSKTNVSGESLILPKRLTGLDLSHTNFTDRGLECLSLLKGLQELDLSATKIKGPGLKQLSQLESLYVLKLNETALTDKTVEALALIKSIYRLDILKTKVSEGKLKEVVNLLPNCKFINGKFK